MTINDASAIGKLDRFAAWNRDKGCSASLRRTLSNRGIGWNIGTSFLRFGVGPSGAQYIFVRIPGALVHQISRPTFSTPRAYCTCHYCDRAKVAELCTAATADAKPKNLGSKQATKSLTRCPNRAPVTRKNSSYNKLERRTPAPPTPPGNRLATGDVNFGGLKRLA